MSYCVRVPVWCDTAEEAIALARMMQGHADEKASSVVAENTELRGLMAAVCAVGDDWYFVDLACRGDVSLANKVHAFTQFLFDQKLVRQKAPAPNSEVTGETP